MSCGLEKENIFNGENPLMKGSLPEGITTATGVANMLEQLSIDRRKEEKKWLYEFAGRAMQAFLGNSYTNGSCQPVCEAPQEIIAEWAVNQAKALLERLKKEEV